MTQHGRTPRLILHIGSQKTGSTSIQAFLKNNSDWLAEQKINYVQAGRTNIAHNSMIQAFRKGHGPETIDAIIDEIQSHPDHIHVMSSEMFFQRGFATALGASLPQDIVRQTKIVAYIRRQDKFIEAMYKQHRKNDRYRKDPLSYLAAHRARLNYSDILAAFARYFGRKNLVVRPFERRNFPKGDIVHDFAAILGLPSLPDTVLLDQPSNASLAREVSEALGEVKRKTDFNTRELIRDLIRTRPEGAFRSNDCFDIETKRALMADLAGDNARVHALYCKGFETLFDMRDLNEMRTNMARNAVQSRRRIRIAQSLIEASIARVYTADPKPQNEVA